MSSRAVRNPLLIVVALVLGASWLPAQGTVTVTYRDNRDREREAKGRFIEHTYAGIKLKDGRNERTIPEDRIIALSHARAPEEYVAALSQFNAGDVRGAVDAFEDVLSDERVVKRNGWIVQEALYRMWQAARDFGSDEDVSAARARLLKAAPKTRYLPQLGLAEAQDFVSAAKWREAASAYGKLLEEARTRGYAPEYVVASGFGQVEALAQSGSTAAARNAHRSLAADAGGDELLKKRVRLLEGTILVAEKKYAEAKAIFSAILKDAARDQHVLIARAANGQGDCNFEMQAYEQAMKDYSVTAALFYDDSERAEDVGWALWRWADACRRASNAIQDPSDERKGKWGRRFRSMRLRVANEFPLTRGGRLARREIGG